MGANEIQINRNITYIVSDSRMPKLIKLLKKIGHKE